MPRPEYWKDCTIECERIVYCTVCHSRKRPNGRSAPAECRYCDYDCPGYEQEPKPGHLWPGELADMDRVEEVDE